MKKRFAIVTALCALLAGATAVPASAASLSGTYKTKIPGNGRLAGTWTIKFSHGNYKVTDNGAVAVRGRYTTSGNKLTMKDTGGPAACGPTGHYRYSISGKTLKFRNIDDRTVACSGRFAVLSRTFTKI
jgi:hypothetical protein